MLPSKVWKTGWVLGWFPPHIFFCEFPTTPHSSELDHTSSESEICHVAPPLEDHWEDQPATDFFLLGSWNWSFLESFFEAPNCNTLRIQRNKGNAGHKMSEVSKKASNLGGSQQCFSNWQFQDSAASEVGRFCPWNCPTSLLCQLRPYNLSLEVSK